MFPIKFLFLGFPDEPSMSWVCSAFPCLHPATSSHCCQGVNHPCDQGRISHHGLYDLYSFLSKSPERLECDRLHVCSIRWYSSVARAAAVSGLFCASGWYLYASGSRTGMSISGLGIQAPGHFTLRSRSDSWHFHSSSSYHHLLSAGTAHSSPTSAPSLRSCSWSYEAWFWRVSS